MKKKPVLIFSGFSLSPSPLIKSSTLTHAAFRVNRWWQWKIARWQCVPGECARTDGRPLATPGGCFTHLRKKKSKPPLMRIKYCEKWFGRWFFFCIYLSHSHSFFFFFAFLLTVFCVFFDPLVSLTVAHLGLHSSVYPFSSTKCH